MEEKMGAEVGKMDSAAYKALWNESNKYISQNIYGQKGKEKKAGIWATLGNLLQSMIRMGRNDLAKLSVRREIAEAMAGKCLEAEQNGKGFDREEFFKTGWTVLEGTKGLKNNSDRNIADIIDQTIKLIDHIGGMLKENEKE
jgi:hypothetical protein